MLQLWLQLISLLCCSEGERVSMCIWEREQEGGRDREAACASTRDLPHSRLPPLCSVPPPFLLSLSPCCVFFFFPPIFFFSLLCSSLIPFFLALSYFLLSSFLLQFSRLLFLRCTLKMTPLILRSRSRQPPGQPQQPSEELCQRASRARICPF